MGQSWPKVMITTSRRPAEHSRTFAAALNHVFPDSMVINRGNYSKDQLRIKAMENLCDYVYFIHSSHNDVDKLIITKVYADILEQQGPELKIHQYIDHKIYGFKSLPESGPLSTDLITRNYNKDLIDYFQKYFFVQFDEKESLWLSLDTHPDRDTSYVSFIDALTQRKFFFAEVELIN